MTLQELKKISYTPGEEDQLVTLLKKSKEPLILTITNFPDKFNIDYFASKHNGQTRYVECHNGLYRRQYLKSFKFILSKIKENLPYRIFAECFTEKMNHRIEKEVPLWKALPNTPKYFDNKRRMPFFFGGKGAVTEIHYDREYGSNLHLCLSGKKRFYLFVENQSKYLYKEPFFGDSILPFTKDYERLFNDYPNLKKANGYVADLQCGDMLFMPKNCWHYVEYLSPSASVCYTFYTKISLQFLGMLKGVFYIWYDQVARIRHKTRIKKFNEKYARASGKKKALYVFLEKTVYLIISVPISTYAYIKLKIKPKRLF